MLAADFRQTDRLGLRVRGLGVMVARPAGIMRQVSQRLLLQTQVRIHFLKESPDGHPWAPWSPAYAKTRKAGHTLLKSSWRMVLDLRIGSTGTTSSVWSLKPYAGVHQGGTVFGPLLAGRGRTPARPFLGLSDDNVDDLERMLAPAFQQLAREALAA